MKKFSAKFAESNLLLVKHSRLQRKHARITRAINKMHHIYNKKVNIFNVKKVGPRVLERVRALKKKADLVTTEMSQVFEEYQSIMKELQS